MTPAPVITAALLEAGGLKKKKSTKNITLVSLVRNDGHFIRVTPIFGDTLGIEFIPLCLQTSEILAFFIHRQLLKRVTNS